SVEQTGDGVPGHVVTVHAAERTGGPPPPGVAEVVAGVHVDEGGPGHVASPVTDPHDRPSGGGQFFVRPDVSAALRPVDVERVGWTQRERDRDVTSVHAQPVLGKMNATAEVVRLGPETPVELGLEPVE